MKNVVDVVVVVVVVVIVAAAAGFVVVVVVVVVDDDDNYNNMAKWALFLPGPIHFKRLFGRRLIPRL